MFGYSLNVLLDTTYHICIFTLYIDLYLSLDIEEMA